MACFGDEDAFAIPGLNFNRTDRSYRVQPPTGSRDTGAKSPDSGLLVQHVIEIILVIRHVAFQRGDAAEHGNAGAMNGVAAT